MLRKLLVVSLMVGTIFGSLIGFNSISYAQPTDDLGSADFQFDLGSITHEDIQEQGWIRGGINFVFERIITIMAATVGSVAVLMMSIGGLLMLSAGGDEQRYNQGKTYVIWSVVGVVFVLSAYILVTAVQLLVKGVYG